MTPAHEPKFGLAVTDDHTFTVPQCVCGWHGAACWSHRVALAVWTQHVADATAPIAPPAIHNTYVGPAPFGKYIAKCNTCAWASTFADHSDCTAAAAEHRRQSEHAAAEPAPPAWLDWSVDTFDADVSERQDVARWQH